MRFCFDSYITRGIYNQEIPLTIGENQKLNGKKLTDRNLVRLSMAIGSL